MGTYDHVSAAANIGVLSLIEKRYTLLPRLLLPWEKNGEAKTVPRMKVPEQAFLDTGKW